MWQNRHLLTIAEEGCLGLQPAGARYRSPGSCQLLIGTILYMSMFPELYSDQDIQNVHFRFCPDERPDPEGSASRWEDLCSLIKSKCKYSNTVSIRSTTGDKCVSFHISADISPAVSIHEVLCYLIYPTVCPEYWAHIRVVSLVGTELTVELQ